MTKDHSKESQELEKLLELFGRPENRIENGIETKFWLSGAASACPRIYKEREETGYRIVGSGFRFIINEKGEKVARLGGRFGREIVDYWHGRPTGYFLTGPCGSVIAYQDSLKEL